MPPDTIRSLLERIIVRGYGPTKHEDRADAVAALDLLDAAPREVGGSPGSQTTRWYTGNRLVLDPEPSDA